MVKLTAKKNGKIKTRVQCFNECSSVTLISPKRVFDLSTANFMRSIEQHKSNEQPIENEELNRDSIRPLKCSTKSNKYETRSGWRASEQQQNNDTRRNKKASAHMME